MNPNAIMHTTTGEKKTLGRRARGQESAIRSAAFSSTVTCARTPLCPRARVRVCTCVCTSGTKSCANTSLPTGGGGGGGGHYCPGPRARASYPVRHFVSAILFARYLAGYFDLDALRSLRYPTFPRTDTQLERCANRCPRVARSSPREIFQLFPLSFPGFRARAREREKGEGKKREGKEKKRRGGKNVKNVREETSERIDRNEQRESFSSP